MRCPKRLLDVLIASSAILITTPLSLVVALAILAEDGAPIIFRSRRLGQHGVEFELYKFRTMKHGAGGSPITVGNDRRITRVGAIIRPLRLDEIPQFWNVVRGDMSMVGPRPEDPSFLSSFEGRYRRILNVRPGITGPTALQFRDETLLINHRADNYASEVLPRKLELDLEYVTRASCMNDLKIMAQTVIQVWIAPLVSRNRRGGRA